MVYDLKTELDGHHIYWVSEIDSFAKIYFKTGKKQSNLDFASLNSYLDPAVDRFNAKTEDAQENLKSTLTKFVRTYAFVSNIVRSEDAQMHKFHAYAKLLLRKLPKETIGTVHLDDEVSLQYYRVQKMFEGSIALSKGDPLPSDKHAGKGKKADEESTLSELVEKLNERFGTEFGDMDKVLMQFVADMERDDNLRTQAHNNSKEHFKFPFTDSPYGCGR